MTITLISFSAGVIFGAAAFALLAYARENMDDTK